MRSVAGSGASSSEIARDRGVPCKCADDLIRGTIGIHGHSARRLHLIEPLAGAAQMALKMREDVVTDGGYPDKILANAPERAGSFFVVPKVVE